MTVLLSLSEIGWLRQNILHVEGYLDFHLISLHKDFLNPFNPLD
jgi:hypothetical protein